MNTGSPSPLVCSLVRFSIRSISGAMEGSHFSSMRSEIGSIPPSKARSITFCDSAMNSARSGSSLLRS